MNDEQGGGLEERQPRNYRPVPDPTELTTDAIKQAVEIAKEYADGRIAVVEEKLRGIDKATVLLNEEVNRVPSRLTLAIDQVQSVVGERFSSIDKQFQERDIRAERESRDKEKAVDAAFAAQKESAAKEGEANTKAIDKSEQQTTETINKLAQLVETRIAGLVDKVEALKERVDRGEANSQGQIQYRTEVRAERTESDSSKQVIIAVVATLFVAGALFLGAYAAIKPTPTQTRIVEVPVQTTPTTP